jgi:quercetin dioxygenase-like cupin family protein
MRVISPSENINDSVTGGRKVRLSRIVSVTRLRVISLAVAVVLVGCVMAVATPSSGITQVMVGGGVYEDIDVDAKRPDWKAWLKVKGTSDVVVNSNTAVPGANGGWHSHPGLSIVSVVEGAVTLYDADDPACMPTVVTAGHGFVEAGDHVHVLRNEGNVQARWITTAIRPRGSAGRIDQPDPGHCPF